MQVMVAHVIWVWLALQGLDHMSSHDFLKAPVFIASFLGGMGINHLAQFLPKVEENVMRPVHVLYWGLLVPICGWLYVRRILKRNE